MAKILSIRIDKPAASDRIPERLEALSITTDRSVNALVLQAIREYLERKEGKTATPEDFTRLLEKTLSLLEVMSDNVCRVQEQADTLVDRVALLETFVDNINRILCNRGKQNEVFAAVIQKLREQANPEWTQEEKEASWRQLAEPDKDVSTGSLFDS